MWKKHLDHQTGDWMVFDPSGNYTGSYDEQTANDIVDEMNKELLTDEQPQ